MISTLSFALYPEMLIFLRVCATRGRMLDSRNPRYICTAENLPYSESSPCPTVIGSGEVLRRQVPHGAAQRVRLGAEGHRLHQAEDVAGAQEIGGHHDSTTFGLGARARPSSPLTLLSSSHSSPSFLPPTPRKTLSLEWKLMSEDETYLHYA